MHRTTTIAARRGATNAADRASEANDLLEKAASFTEVLFLVLNGEQASLAALAAETIDTINAARNLLEAPND